MAQPFIEHSIYYNIRSILSMFDDIIIHVLICMCIFYVYVLCGNLNCLKSVGTYCIHLYYVSVYMLCSSVMEEIKSFFIETQFVDDADECTSYLWNMPNADRLMAGVSNAL